MDLAVSVIAASKDGAPPVTVESWDRPVTLRVTYADGRATDLPLPAETWIRQSVTAIPVPRGRVTRAELDPDNRLPDRDRTNNDAHAVN